MNPKVTSVLALLCFFLSPGQAAGLFAGKSGAYEGVAPYAALQVRVTEAGAFSAVLQSTFKTFRLSGTFDSNGNTDVLNLRFRDGTIHFKMQFDGETIGGQFLDLGFAIYSRRCPFNVRTNPASAYAGPYTVIISGNDNDASFPKGDSFATLKIDLAGRAAIRGKFSDGISFSRSTLLTQDGDCPFLLPLQGTKEFAVVRLSIGDFGDHDMEGALAWRRTQQPVQRLFSAGFEIAPSVKGFRYHAPTDSEESVLQLTNALVVLDGGTLGISFTNRVTFASGNKVLNESSNALKISIRLTDGSFSGVIKPPGSTRGINVQGAVAQGQNYASGYFLGSNQCGRVSIHSPPPPLTVAIETIYTNIVPAASNTFTAQLNNPGASVVWSFGDGTVVSNSLSISHAWAALGDYTVTLKAYDEFTPSGVSATLTIHVLDHVTHYVSQQNTNPVFPFLSWNTAATNIQDAVDAVVFADSTVLVSDGVYESGAGLAYGSNRVAITQRMLVQSVNGAASTVIKGKRGTSNPPYPTGIDAIRCVYLCSEAVLNGFTLTNGSSTGFGNSTNSAYNAGGIFCESTHAVVSNCVVVGTLAYGAMYSGTAYNCYFCSNMNAHMGEVSESVLNSCTFSNNTAVDAGGAVYHCTLSRCVLAENLASAGGAALSSTLEDCVLVANGASTSGGAAIECILNSCLVLSNSAYGRGGGLLNCTANNCTVVGNASSDGGGAADSTLNNCVVYYNSAPNAPNYSSSYYPMTLNYCCTSPMPPNGAGNLTSEPQFLDLESGDFQLAPTSPCIDAGNNLYATNSFDLNGNPRICNGTVDMGAYELAPFSSQSEILRPPRK